MIEKPSRAHIRRGYTVSPMARRFRWCALALALCLLAAACSSSSPTASPAEPGVPSPEEYQAPAWQVLGGDQPITAAKIAQLNDPNLSDLKPGAANAAQAVRPVVLAELTGVGRQTYGEYWPDGNGGASANTAYCTKVQIEAVSVARLPTVTGTYAKALVLWNGACPYPPAGAPWVLYIYLRQDASGWTPVHPSQIAANADVRSTNVIPPWALKALPACGNPHNTGFQARIEVADALGTLCSDAAKAGVSLTITEAYLTPAEQQKRFLAAVKHYGSQETAQQYVAFSDGTSCESLHCSGLALDVAAGAGRDWLRASVGCAANGNVRLTTSPCATGETAVLRAFRYGFDSPLSFDPGYFEFVLPVAEVGGACDPANTSSVPQLIASVWRCELQQLGLATNDVNHVVAEAEVVSLCASGWDPSAHAFGGRFATTPDPTTGKLYTQAGLFMLSSGWANVWVSGGAANVADPVANADGAARFYVAERLAGRWGFDIFGCATGGNVDGVHATSILPEKGGPALPSWSTQY